MTKWIARLVRMLDVEREKWRVRNQPVTLEFMNAAVRESIGRFPEDRVALEAAALSELSLRQLLGRRRFDA